ncbi:hypothetical protein [Cryptosporangium aurantiacum]|uniref:Uncharacterized protein n=1 Tax=Cryptosporangium aurantiacum TaxID=134849 RepID=A0A1M7Q7D6_9ACTN|nr:hypothetical protein [Cryptosporangium aurantiacum]SHN26427.1 hypothetical protein SAMN05443668_104260 [Cryptosporangium aurantiacum]
MAEPDTDDRAAALFAHLRADQAPSFAGPGPDAVAAAGRRRRRTRWVALAAAAVVVGAAAGAAITAFEEPQTLRPIERPVTSVPPSAATPSPGGSPSASSSSSSPTSSSSPSPSGTRPSPGKVTSLRATDWKNAILSLPTWASCVEPRLRFSGGEARGNHPEYGGLIYRMLPYGRTPVYADLTGDNIAEAVVVVSCAGSAPMSRAGNEDFPAVVVYTENEKGGPRLLGVVPGENPQTTGPEYTIVAGEHGTGMLMVNQNPINSGDAGWVPYRWTGSTFVRS